MPAPRGRSRSSAVIGSKLARAPDRSSPPAGTGCPTGLGPVVPGSLAGGIEHSNQLHRSDCPVGVLADRVEFLPVGGFVESDADPTTSSHVRRTKEPIRLGRNELLLCPCWSRAPEVWEPVIVMTAWPEHQELLPHEERRRTMAEPLSHLRQCHTDCPHSGFRTRGIHEARRYATAPPTWRPACHSARGFDLAETWRGFHQRHRGGPVQDRPPRGRPRDRRVLCGEVVEALARRQIDELEGVWTARPMVVAARPRRQCLDGGDLSCRAKGRETRQRPQEVLLGEPAPAALWGTAVGRQVRRCSGS